MQNKGQFYRTRKSQSLDQGKNREMFQQMEQKRDSFSKRALYGRLCIKNGKREFFDRQRKDDRRKL